MSIDILRSFAEARAGDGEIVPGITYGVCRDLLAERDRLLEDVNALTEIIAHIYAEEAELLVWLREISDMDPRKLDTGYYAVNRAKSARKEVGDE